MIFSLSSVIIFIEFLKSFHLSSALFPLNFFWFVCLIWSASFLPKVFLNEETSNSVVKSKPSPGIILSVGQRGAGPFVERPLM